MRYRRRVRHARTAFVLGGLCAAALPIAFGLERGDGIDAACDEAVVRDVGRAYTGALHGLDALLGAPLGGRAHWASLACAAGLAVVAYVLARRLLRASAHGGFGVALAIVAAALATLTFPAQREAALVGGSVLGALLVLSPVVLASEGASARWIAAALGLAATYDAPTGAAAALGCAALAMAAGKKPAWRAAPFALVGLVPIAWMLFRRAAAPDAALDVSMVSGWLGEGARSVPRDAALHVARGELGIVALATAAGGALVALRSRVTRPLGAALACVAVVGVAASALGAPAGPARFGGALLAGLAAVAVLAAGGMGALVSFVAAAHIPFARASAAMIVLLELAVPARVADDASLAMSKLPARATHRWNARFFGDLPRDAVVFLPSTRLVLRSRAAAATGELRPDVSVLATSGPSARATGRIVAREPLLAPIVRDLALYGAPEELSLSELAGARPLFVAFDARWDRRFARHLLPEGAFDRYLVEPRGASERARAFAQSPLDGATAAAIASDAALLDATRDVLAARALAAAAAGEREYADAATAELRRLAPADRLGVELERRVASMHGALDVTALARRSRD